MIGALKPEQRIRDRLVRYAISGLALIKTDQGGPGFQNAGCLSLQVSFSAIFLISDGCGGGKMEEGKRKRDCAQ